MIGDVVGHGVRAAATMGELRHALRAYAAEGHSPGRALQQLDRLVQSTVGAGMVATVLFLILDVEAGTIVVARAGHPPPALRRAGGRVQLLDTDTTLPLGLGASAPPGEAVYEIAPGDTLLLYTDGLIERRGESITVGVQRLRKALSAAPSGAEQLCEHVVERLLGQHPSDDDVAVLAVRLIERQAGALELTLDAAAASVPFARHQLRAWLADNAPEFDRGTRGELEVALSEACTNVVRHAYGPRQATFDVRASRDGDTVELTVRDHGSWRPPRGQHGGRGIALMRAICDEVIVDRRAEGTQVTMRRVIDSSPAASGDARA
jgi:anti-sigma regulatory factor (Ser/Thr protein kinase)